MSKLLVAPKHDPQPLPNGSDNCYARWGSHGCCPGLKLAEWLNGLGDDDEFYGRSKIYKNLDTRLNWLKGSDHLVALEPEVARLKEIARKAARKLAEANQRLIAITGEEAPQ